MILELILLSKTLNLNFMKWINMKDIFCLTNRFSLTLTLFYDFASKIK